MREAKSRRRGCARTIVVRPGSGPARAGAGGSLPQRDACGATVFFLAALLLASCDDDLAGPQTIEDATFAASLQIDLAAMTRTASGLYYEDIEPGSGDPVAAGQEVAVSYTGWLIDGTVFDDGQFSFRLGSGQVVAGFDEGVTGMRPGAVRRIIIPPELGYGSQGRGSVPPNAIMIFRIALLQVG